MAAQGWFTQGDIDVAPGTTAVLRMVVTNLADTTDSFVLTPVGMAAGWATIQPAVLTLFGGAQDTIEVELRPPLLPSTTAGPTSLSVRIAPQQDPDNAATAETTIVIGASFDRRINVLQPAQRGRRGATYEMMLENRGNTQASCRLHLVDPSGRVDGTFDPPAAGIEPGSSTLVRLKVRANGLLWRRHPRTIPFRIDADQPGSPTASAPATFVQTPMVPERLVGKLIASAGVAALLAGAWFGLIKPAIRDAADDAVADIEPIATLAPSESTLPDDPGEPSETTVPGQALDQGTIVNFQLPVSVAQAQSDSNEYTVPAGKRLQVTDLIIQNPQSDQGTLTVSRGTSTLLGYNLLFVAPDVFVPLVTPLELAPGEQLVVTVACYGVGDPTATACNPTVLVSGVLVDA